MKVRLTVQICDADGAGAGRWFKDVDMDFLPPQQMTIADPAWRAEAMVGVMSVTFSTALDRVIADLGVIPLDMCHSVKGRTVGPWFGQFGWTEESPFVVESDGAGDDQ